MWFGKHASLLLLKLANKTCVSSYGKASSSQYSSLRMYQFGWVLFYKWQPLILTQCIWIECWTLSTFSTILVLDCSGLFYSLIEGGLFSPVEWNWLDIQNLSNNSDSCFYNLVPIRNAAPSMHYAWTLQHLSLSLSLSISLSLGPTLTVPLLPSPPLHSTLSFLQVALMANFHKDFFSQKIFSVLSKSVTG